LGLFYAIAWKEEMILKVVGSIKQYFKV
jgi:hypothetical protein